MSMGVRQVTADVQSSLSEPGASTQHGHASWPPVLGNVPLLDKLGESNSAWILGVIRSPEGITEHRPQNELDLRCHLEETP